MNEKVKLKSNEWIKCNYAAMPYGVLMSTELSHCEKLIVCALIGRAEEWKCTVSYRTLATQLNMSEKTIERAVHRLAELGILHEIGKIKNFREHYTNTYFVNKNHPIFNDYIDFKSVNRSKESVSEIPNNPNRECGNGDGKVGRCSTSDATCSTGVDKGVVPASTPCSTNDAEGVVPMSHYIDKVKENTIDKDKEQTKDKTEFVNPPDEGFEFDEEEWNRSSNPNYYEPF